MKRTHTFKALAIAAACCTISAVAGDPEPVASVIDVASVTALGTHRLSAENSNHLNSLGMEISRYWTLPVGSTGHVDNFLGAGGILEHANGHLIAGAVGKYAYAGMIGAELGPIFSENDFGATSRAWFGFGVFGFQVGANYLITKSIYKTSFGFYASIPIHMIVDGKHSFFPRFIPLGPWCG